MAGYRRRLERDLDGWIAGGLVPADNRDAILGSVGEARRLDAATVLGIIGGLLAGVAVIAFIAANWSAIPRLVRFAMILAAFLGAAGGAAWAQGRGRPIVAQVLLSVAALIFGAAIGLTGQIFDIAGDPQAALRGAGLAAALLALAGRSPWAAAVGLVFLALGDFTGRRFFNEATVWAGWLVVAAPLAAALALAWRSQALAHAAGLSAIVAVLTLDVALRQEASLLFLAASVVLAAGALAVRSLRDRFEASAGVLYGWWVWGALLWFGVAGFDGGLKGIWHSVVWLAISVGVVVLGRHERNASVTAAGVLGLFGGAASLLFNLGVGLLTSAAVFGALALAALAVAFTLRRRRAA